MKTKDGYVSSVKLYSGVKAYSCDTNTAINIESDSFDLMAIDASANTATHDRLGECLH